MERFNEIVLEAWREAGRHLAIRHSAANITRLLAEQLPLSHLLVRRLDAVHSTLETVAVGQLSQAPAPPLTRTLLNPSRVKRLMSWGREGNVVRLQPGVPDTEQFIIVPAEMTTEVLAGPLTDSKKTSGVLILVAVPGKSFRRPHLQMMAALLDPFSAALENDRRLHELETLRQAAEADRQSLLARLGRQEIGDTIVGADSGLRLVMERVQLVA